MTIAKALTQPDAPVRRAARRPASVQPTSSLEPLGELLGRATLFIFSTTQATNAILEGTTARTAFLCTEGFPDILVRREGGSLHPYDYSRPVPRALRPAPADVRDPRADRRRRRRRRAARSRTPRASSSRALERPRGRGGRGVPAVVDRQPRARAGARRADRARSCPGVPVHALAPAQPDRARVPARLGTAIDASLKPLMQRHLPRDRERPARRRASPASCSSRRSLGGVLHDRASWSSGPIHSRATPVRRWRRSPAQRPTRAEAGAGDVDRLRHGRHQLRRQPGARRRPRVHARDLARRRRSPATSPASRSVDVRSIGAGGGSIAWVDAGGLLRVGPTAPGRRPARPATGAAATSRPSPTRRSCSATSIPDHFLGGRMALDASAAARRSASRRRAARARRRRRPPRRSSRSPTST